MIRKKRITTMQLKHNKTLKTRTNQTKQDTKIKQSQGNLSENPEIRKCQRIVQKNHLKTNTKQRKNKIKANQHVSLTTTNLTIHINPIVGCQYTKRNNKNVKTQILQLHYVVPIGKGNHRVIKIKQFNCKKQQKTIFLKKM